MHVCTLCTCPPFGEAINALDHSLLSHAALRSYDSVELSLRTLNDEQWVYIIKMRIMLREFIRNIKNINVKRDKYFPDRNLEAIRAYKSKYDAARSGEDGESL